jgi:hypothetical protein
MGFIVRIWYSLDWIYQAQFRAKWLAVVNGGNGALDSIKWEEFLDWLRNC